MVRELFNDILARTSSPEAMTWLRSSVDRHKASFHQRTFYYDFSGVSRHFDKRHGIRPTTEQLAEIEGFVPGLGLADWDEFRLARVILLLVLAEQDRGIYLDTLAQLLNTADIREQAAIYASFSLLPEAPELVGAAIDGLRSNIIEVYDSIALDNPFPSTHFPEAAWNQMVLKALFIHRPLARMVGLDDRRNPALAEAIRDLAHERWAAGRDISPEAWRCCEPYPELFTEEDRARGALVEAV
jgi:hypothetical protein